jgi:hypothetical protein
MRTFAFAAIVSLTVVGAAVAAEINVVGVITKVEKKGDGDKVEYTVYYKPFPKKKGTKVEPIARKVAAGCVVAEGKRDPADPKKINKGEAIDKGLANEAFPTKDGDPGAVVSLTIDEDKGAIVQILVLFAAKKKGGK